jgi:hypothetical protein
MTQHGESQQTAPVRKVETGNPAETRKPAEAMPAAGPHARPELTNYEACPGAGALPSETPHGRDSDPGAG